MHEPAIIGDPGVGADTGSAADAQSGGTGDGGKANFTPEQQAYVNNIVARRVTETKKGYEEATRDQQILHGLLKDPEFQTWMNNPKGRGGQPQPNQASLVDQLAGNEETTVQDVIRAIPKIIEESLGSKLEPINKTMNDFGNFARGVGTQSELTQMANSVDDNGNAKYPHLWNESFRKDVMEAVARGRSGNFNDAYRLVNLDWQDTGKGVPKTAFLLESHGGGGYGRANRGGGDEPESYSRKDLGLKDKSGIRDILSAVMDRVNKT